MDIVIKETTEEAVRFTAKLIASLVKRKPDAVLGLATGRTMEAVYAELGEMHRNGGLDFSLCKSFNLDEYVGLKGDDPNSYRYYMNKHLFSKINMDLRNTHVENGAAEDLEAECADYERKMREAGGVDLQLLGIGRSGHIGFNEPLSPLKSRTRAVVLSPVTYAQNSPLFADPKDMPMRALTMGVGTILDARRLLLLATGAEKADIVAKALEGPVTGMISASALQFHNDAVAVLDRQAAAKLAECDYYDFTFANDPKWAGLRD